MHPISATTRNVCVRRGEKRARASERYVLCRKKQTLPSPAEQSHLLSSVLWAKNSKNDQYAELAQR